MVNFHVHMALHSLAAMLLLVGCERLPDFIPVCQIEKVVANSEMFIINGEPDAGAKVFVTVQNIGQPGDISVSTRLGTSEGDWERTRTRWFKPSETQVIRFDFPEPTINASNIQAFAACQWVGPG